MILGCSGLESNSSSSTDAVNSVLQCNNSDVNLRKPTRSGLKRMSVDQFKYTYSDLFETFFTQSELNGLIRALDFSSLPEDVHSSMSIFDQSFSPLHAEAYMKISEEARDHIFSRASLRDKIFGSCHSNVNDNNCLNSFISSFGLRTQRRPLTVEQVQSYVDVFNLDRASGYENLLVLMLNSPFFVYNMEIGTDFLNFGFTKLTQFELASKLSYLYLRSMPDDVLFQKAQSNQLLSDQEIESEIDRLLSLDKVRVRLTKSFADQWLKIKNTPDLMTDSPAMQATLSTLNTSVSPQQIKDSVIQEVYDYLDYHIWENKSKFSEMMTSNTVFPRNAFMAEIYGTDVWSGDYRSLIRAPENERAGVLTLAHYLFTGRSTTRPIMRGVNFYKRFYCGELPSPADNTAPEGIVIRDDFTEREKVTAMTEHPDSACISCHQPIINPIGFSFENFDSLGRFRVRESVYASDLSSQQGQVLVERSVDNNTTVQLVGMAQPVEVSRPSEFIKGLAKTDHVEACFAKTVWRFGISEDLNNNQGGCASLGLLKDSSTQLQGNVSVLQMFKNIGLQPEFKYKRIF